MDNLDKIKSLSKKIAASLLKGALPIDLEEFDTLTKEDKKRIIFNVINKNKREERLQFKNKLNTQEAWDAIIINHNKQRAIKRRTFWYSAVAASLVILLGITFLLNKDYELWIDTVIAAEKTIKAGTDKAVLTLANGSEVQLEKDQPYQSNTMTSNGEELIYVSREQVNKIETEAKGIAYNMLTVPRGGQFRIILSDGTKVWLNSESQLRYPIMFNDFETRRVELLYGEAYFDVSSSTLHHGTKFNVSNQFQEIEVLGTEFNIRAYKEETNIYTTLIEGKVVIKSQDKEQVLEPAQQLNLNTKNNDINIETVDNMHNEISWKEGEFSFQNKTLKDIMKILSRWYDMEVIFENKDVEVKTYTGSFNKSNSIEDVLSVIKYTNDINSYYIKNKMLIIR
ncbi:FecR family protein [Flavivirga eckloniae]|uniref:Anti-sigma factor n=1 Tax=Flavivirga eckloniae TaxID=1803846 RepID=A0A2K9PW29_9FLAO|nr:FecR family protein [Flavivirga eckloniae]AUP81264.1 hypothetical protein C1H87_22110 [Flavivirga eckloniae]